MTEAFLGIMLMSASALAACGGFFVFRKYFRSHEPRIGAIDQLFSRRGLAYIFLFAVFHIVWFGLPFSLLVLGMSYFF